MENVHQLGEGWNGEEALAIAVYAVLSASSFEEAITIAANHDGDSDSTASIAGQIYGAWHPLVRQGVSILAEQLQSHPYCMQQILFGNQQKILVAESTQ